MTEKQAEQKRIYYQANKEKLLLAAKIYRKSISKGPKPCPTTCKKCGAETEKKERKLCKGMCRPCYNQNRRDTYVPGSRVIVYVYKERDKAKVSDENRKQYLKRNPEAKEYRFTEKKVKTKKVKPPKMIKLKLCGKCGKEKEYAEFEPRKQHCKCCKEEAIRNKKNRIIVEKHRKEVVNIERVIKPPKPLKPKTTKQERPNVRVILPKDDIYGRKYKDVSRDWDKKMEGIRKSIELSKNKTT